jgi:hypothetical protein
MTLIKIVAAPRPVTHPDTDLSPTPVSTSPALQPPPAGLRPPVVTRILPHQLIHAGAPIECDSFSPPGADPPRQPESRSALLCPPLQCSTRPVLHCLWVAHFCRSINGKISNGGVRFLLYRRSGGRRISPLPTPLYQSGPPGEAGFPSNASIRVVCSAHAASAMPDQSLQFGSIVAMSSRTLPSTSPSGTRSGAPASW